MNSVAEIVAPPANTQSFRDRVSTVDEKGKRVWVYPQKPKGKLYNWRTLLSVLYVAVLFGLPFVKVNGHPLFLFNVIERQFILFGQIFWPQDFFIFGVGMIVFIVFIGLFTNVFGRVFCGWMCPQTIFLEMIFRKIEYWIEGDRPAQKMLDKAPWTGSKIAKKVGKWTAFWTLSFIIANTFLAYIIGVDELFKIVTEPVSEHVGGFTAIMAFTSAFFFVYLWFREQVCTVVCPYGRLQGVLMDKKTIVVAFDYTRGEPRGKFKKNQQRELGDCIDCNQCVNVCPTGIDIRNGTQLECVNCTACIDACNRMMEAVGLPLDLIRYTSEHNLETGTKKFRFTRKMKVFTVIMVALLGVEVALLATRIDIGVNVMRTPGQLFQELPNNQLGNLYNYKLLNKTYADKDVVLKPENFKGSIEIVGGKSLQIPAEGYSRGSMFIKMDRKEVKGHKTELKIGVYEGDERIETVKASFVGPFAFN
jgi:cytochrome c oxidase accessory protein FixG